jgi:hypothetical protein
VPGPSAAGSPGASDESESAGSDTGNGGGGVRVMACMSSRSGGGTADGAQGWSGRMCELCMAGCKRCVVMCVVFAVRVKCLQQATKGETNQ